MARSAHPASKDSMPGRAAALRPDSILVAGGQRLARARTFSDVPRGQAFWYENSNGLAEIAVNCGRAATTLGLCPGAKIECAGL